MAIKNASPDNQKDGTKNPAKIDPWNYRVNMG